MYITDVKIIEVMANNRQIRFLAISFSNTRVCMGYTRYTGYLSEQNHTKRRDSIFEELIFIMFIKPFNDFIKIVEF